MDPSPLPPAAHGVHPASGLPVPNAFNPWQATATFLAVASTTHPDADTLAHLQRQRLTALLVAAGRSPLCARWLEGLDPATARLQDLPVSHKADLMRHFDEWVTDPLLKLSDLQRFVEDPTRIAEAFHDRYTVWESSGSSGAPGIFVQDEACMAVYDALEALRRPWWLSPLQHLLDPWGLNERLAFVGAVGGHFASIVSLERLKHLQPAMSSRLHPLSFLQPIRSLLAQLQALSPTVMATYPSTALILAHEQLAGRLGIHPREIWTGGETLTACVRLRIEQAFGCRVINSYGASEFLTLGCECDQGSLHLNSDWVLLESVDAEGQPAPAGQSGVTTLLTNLANHVQPLIRYDLGDQVTNHGAVCTCGSALPVIEVQGRDDDSLNLTLPGSAPVHISALAVSTVLESEAGLFDFQLVQQGPTDLLLRTGVSGPHRLAVVHRAHTLLDRFLRQQGAEGVRIHDDPHHPLEMGRSGKVKRVIGGCH